MILTIDIGNTNVSLACVSILDEEVASVDFCAKLKTERSWGTEEYRPGFREYLLTNHLTASMLEGAVVSSVVPTVMEAMCENIREQLDMEPMVITADCDLGMTLDVLEPYKVGRDRLVDSAWAAAQYPLPVVTADLGTATTFNVITEGPVFRGGVIAAGLETGLKALASRTAQLPAIELRLPEKIIGRDTASCMLSGAIAGTAGIVDGITADIEAELGQPVTLVITGGGSRYVDALVRHPHVYDENLILKGMAYLYCRNAK